MTEVPDLTTNRILIIGGGIAGLSASVRLAQAGLPVTLFEESTLGHGASTRNQGWLHSGGWFAKENIHLASRCYKSLQQTIQCCPDCLEPQQQGMAYLFSNPDTDVSSWLTAWENVGIPFKKLPVEEIFEQIPRLDKSQIHDGYLLPDRSIRPEILLNQIATTAEKLGVEIRTQTHISDFLKENCSITGVVTGAGEEIPGRAVVLACGAAGASLCSSSREFHVGEQSEFTWVALKSHLVSVSPGLSNLPFCVVDRGGFNHIPHAADSIFGNNRWKTVPYSIGPDVDPDEIEQTLQTIKQLIPTFSREEHKINSWSGIATQAMHVDQIEPGQAPLPTVIDHSLESPSIQNLFSIFPGRATLWPQLAEETRKTILEKFKLTDIPSEDPPWNIQE